MMKILVILVRKMKTITSKTFAIKFKINNLIKSRKKILRLILVHMLT